MMRILVIYAKEGYASFLSHRETIRALEKALRRSGFPLYFTAGFSPRPRMTFAPALPLGVAAEAEYLEVAVEAPVDESEARERLNESLPDGLWVRELRLLPATMPKLSRWARYGLYRIEDGVETKHLLLVLQGEGQGRLRDALRALAAIRGSPEGRRVVVTRAGLYASPDEVSEDVTGEVFLYHGGREELREVSGEGTERSGGVRGEAGSGVEICPNAAIRNSEGE